jgi:hypothetical protein
MPPSVACALVDTSTGYHRPCGLSCAFRWSSTRPGSTVAVARRRQVQHAAQVLAAVDDQRGAGGLAALAGAAAAWQHRHLQLARDGQRGGHVFGRLRHEHAHRHDLVDRRIGGITPARSGGVEQHLAARFGAQAALPGGAHLVGRQHGAGGGPRASGRRRVFMRRSGCRADAGGVGQPGRRPARRISCSTASRLCCRCCGQHARAARRRRARPAPAPSARAPAPRAATWRSSWLVRKRSACTRALMRRRWLRQHRVARRGIDGGVDARVQPVVARQVLPREGRPASRSAGRGSRRSRRRWRARRPARPTGPPAPPAPRRRAHVGFGQLDGHRAAVGQQVDQAFGGQQLDGLAQRRARHVQLLAQLTLVELGAGAMRPSTSRCAAAASPGRAGRHVRCR